MIFNKFQRQAAHKKLDEIFDKDKRAKVEEVKDKRTLSQNSLYWLWVACIRGETGNDKDDLHEVLLEMFAPTKVIDSFGVFTERPIRTSKMDTKQFTDYLDRIQVFAATELSIRLPDPQDKDWVHFEDTYKHML